MFTVALKNIKRQEKNEQQGEEEKPRTVVLKEREFRDRQQLLNELESLREKLCLSERDNSRLKADLQRVKEQVGRRDQEITSLHRHLSALERDHKSAVLSCRQLDQQYSNTEEHIKKRDEEIVSLQREIERVRASVEQLKASSGLKTTEEKWQREISQLKELLGERDRQVSRAEHKRQARTKAYLDTMTQLTETQVALKQGNLRCQALEEQLQKQLAEAEERHQKELTEREECFKEQLSVVVNTSKKELSELSESWEGRAQQWEKAKKEREEIMSVKEKIWKKEQADLTEDIESLVKQNIHLQV